MLVAEELQRRGRKDIKIVLIGEGKEKENLMKQALKGKITNIVFHKPVSKIKLTGANVRSKYWFTSSSQCSSLLPRDVSK